MNKVTELLDTLAEYQSQKDAAMLAKQEVIDSILTPEIKAQLAAIDEEFTIQTAAVDANITSLTDEIKALVIERAPTVAEKERSIKGAYLQAVYSKPRTSWDTEGLDGYAVAHPEITKFRKTGKPSVSIRKA